jgi:hypothetical protein
MLIFELRIVSWRRFRDLDHSCNRLGFPKPLVALLAEHDADISLRSLGSRHDWSV